MSKTTDLHTLRAMQWLSEWVEADPKYRTIKVLYYGAGPATPPFEIEGGGWVVSIYSSRGGEKRGTYADRSFPKAVDAALAGYDKEVTKSRKKA